MPRAERGGGTRGRSPRAWVRRQDGRCPDFGRSPPPPPRRGTLSPRCPLVISPANAPCARDLPGEDPILPRRPNGSPAAGTPFASALCLWRRAPPIRLGSTGRETPPRRSFTRSCASTSRSSSPLAATSLAPRKGSQDTWSRSSAVTSLVGRFPRGSFACDAISVTRIGFSPSPAKALPSALHAPRSGWSPRPRIW